MNILSATEPLLSNGLALYPVNYTSTSERKQQCYANWKTFAKNKNKGSLWLPWGEQTVL
jgi:hypothetical protein